MPRLVALRAPAAIAELEGYRVEFRRGASGRIEELIYLQPNGTFVVKRANGNA